MAYFERCSPINVLKQMNGHFRTHTLATLAHHWLEEVSGTLFQVHVGNSVWAPGLNITGAQVLLVM